ncbi:MAG: nitrilase-related carbon-nitrogen hydrolase [Armatimonadota bacterium]|nr:nitrilase-related carbon-nitrogen hydrolase [Armatimonadota bacterium]MDR7420951.1 nitrilase-related carbon-nitrogen hydrolase [Armatimonadota bacterium]
MTRIAVIQMAAPWSTPAAARAHSVGLLRRAAAAGAQLAVLPELCTISYDFRGRGDVEPHAEPLDGPSVRAWEAVARETGLHVVAGLPERDGETLYNSAVVVGPGGLLGAYRKAHLYAFERGIFAPGAGGFPVWHLPVGRVGVLICYDLRFAEAVRLLLLDGAEVLCVPTTWTDRGKPEPWDARGWCGADYLAAGHAYGNRMWVACADRAGPDGGVRTLGCSAIFAPSGMAAAGPAGPDGDEVLVADCDLGRADAARATPEMDLVADRRPALYARLARARPSRRGRGRAAP